jgi:hypothetical protein
MSSRTSIVNAIAEKLKSITKDNGYNTDLWNQVHPTLKFWDECNNFPSIYMSAGTETRDYLPGGFTWGFLGVSLKLYVKGEFPSEQLELLMEDVEKCINTNRTLTYNSTAQTTEILINSLITDEGLLEPYGVGEINITVQYQVL